VVRTVLDLVVRMVLVNYRAANAADAAPVARLHAESWRRHYRGAYPDAYLDSDVFTERSAVWADRFRSIGEDSYTIVADRDGEVVGFAHTILDSDPDWGALLDNLHVRFELKRQGVGRALMAETARVLGQRRPSSGLYLGVLKQNTAAQAFYSAMGGAVVGERVDAPLPGGGTAPVLRYAWTDPSVLVGQNGQ
jgi:ribosomal protein S18 acetylase RimI-like enzyme